MGNREGYLSARLVALREEAQGCLNPGELKLQQELMNLLWQGKREKHRRLLKLKQLVDGPSEVETTKIRPQRLEGLLAAEGELKSVSGVLMRDRKCCALNGLKFF